ncbi:MULTISPECIES: DUF6174 domain-containing protein [unclassified Streptomyces]|uniref:DUF6174 domain-containing protein n=1 Tax=unclassified Streptomyces TaxID=2593676 RepID=UPI0022B65E6B|nr:MULTISPECIES: DUF6174 domain-containing protein [unclassified Streptomyces]MCZ7414910.1 DUF6174 domain-containing protein [Streptomyces sp. WMMC897]MCZ7431853.1 DUF6174 domain-containing protein [Streptomyces sp. WMMC1477]
MGLAKASSTEPGYWRRAAFGLLIVPLALPLAACAKEAESGPGRGEPEWSEPSDYAYTLTQSCGFNVLAGTFRVTVTEGRATEWEPVGENPAPGNVEVPTIGGLLEKAEKAERNGADSVEVERADDGRPTLIEIDRYANGIDDEVCYEITGFESAG